MADEVELLDNGELRLPVADGDDILSEGNTSVYSGHSTSSPYLRRTGSNASFGGFRGSFGRRPGVKGGPQAFDYDLKFSKHRLAVRELVLSTKFEAAMLLLVVFNCVVLSISTHRGTQTAVDEFVNIANTVITCIFVLECILKMIGFGLFIKPWKPPPSARKPVVAAHSGGYFRNPWCLVDFIITAVTFGSLFQSGGAVGGMRAFRVLRIFKMTESLSVKILINSVTSSIPKLLRVFAIFLSLLLVLSILGVSLWQGALQHRCVAPEAVPLVNATRDGAWFSYADLMHDLQHPTTLLEDQGRLAVLAAISDLRCWKAGPTVPSRADSLSVLPTLPKPEAAKTLAWLAECLYPTRTTHLNLGTIAGGTPLQCDPGNTASCPFNYECLAVENPYMGQLGFDNTGMSALALMVVVSMRGWSDVMYLTEASVGQASTAFFVTAVLTGAFCMLNLTLVVIIYAFEKMHHRCVADHKLRERKKRAVESLRGERNTVVAGATKTLKFKLKSILATGTAEALTQGMPCEVRVQGVWIQGVAGVISHDEIKVYCESGAIYTATRYVDVKAIPMAKWRCAARRWTRTAWFSHATTVVSVLNLIALALDHHPEPAGLSDVLRACYLVFYVLYVLEFVVKLAGFGLLPYLRDSWNVLDFGIVVGCTVGLATGRSSFMYITTLRGVRLIRMFKLSLRLLTLRKWVLVVTRSLRSAICLVLLYALLVFTFALMGMQLLSGEYCGILPGCAAEEIVEGECHCSPRENFDTISNAMFTVFRVLTGEGWGREMMVAMSVQGPGMSVYFLILYFLGNYLLINLFVAIFFHQARVVEAAEAFTAVVQTKGEAAASAPGTPRSVNSPQSWGSQRGRKGNNASPSLSEPLIAGELSPVCDDDGPEWSRRDSIEVISTRPSNVNDEIAGPSGGCDTEGNDSFLSDLHQPLERAFFCVPAEAGWRVALAKVIESTPFNALVLLAIALSTVMLGFESPHLPPDSSVAQTLQKCDLAVTIFFTIEMVLRVVTYGFVMHKSSYLRRDFCSPIDFFVVVTSWIALGTGASNLATSKVLRLCRPLRFIGTSLGLRVVITSLVHSAPALLSVYFISFVVWGSWAIMGVQLFKGSLYQCSSQVYGDLTGQTRMLTVDGNNVTFDLNLRTDCEAYSAQVPGMNVGWRDYHSSFDNTAKAILSLFEIAAHGGWRRLVFLAVDSQNYDHAPVGNAQPLLALYFITFIVIGGFLVRALFVTVVLDSYTTDAQRLQSKRGVGMLTESQKLWIQSYREMLRSAKKPPEFFYSKNKGACVKAARAIVGKPAFEYFIQGCIICNIVVMATQHYNQSSTYTLLQTWTEFVFLTVFWVEFVLKLIAFRVKGFFAQKWNRFDFVILLLITPGVIIEATIGGGVGAAAGVLRVIRLTRVLKLFRQARGVIIVCNAIFFSLPGMANVCGVLGLNMMIFAAIGVMLFGLADRGVALTGYCNFESSPTALLTLFRIGTGEDWPSILAELRRDEPECTAQLGGCVSTPVAVTYFVSYIFITMFVLYNLFIGVLYDALLTVVREAKTEGDLKKQHMQAFRTAWNELDPDREFKVSAALLPALLKGTGPPLGVRKDTLIPEVWRVIAELDLNIVEGDVDMQTILQALFLRLVGTPEEIDMPGFLIEAVTMKADQRFQAGKRDEKIARTGAESLPVHVVVGIVKAQAAVRGMIARRRIRNKYFESRAQLLRKAGVVEDGPKMGTKQLVLPAAE